MLQNLKGTQSSGWTRPATHKWSLNVVKDELVESRQATFDAIKARTDDRKDLSGVKKKLASTEKALTEAQGLLDATLQREGELDARVKELEAKLEGATRNDTRDPVTGRYVGLRNRGKPQELGGDMGGSNYDIRCSVCSRTGEVEIYTEG